MRFSGAMPKSDSRAKLFFLLPTHKDDEKSCHPLVDFSSMKHILAF